MPGRLFQQHKAYREVLPSARGRRGWSGVVMAPLLEGIGEQALCYIRKVFAIFVEQAPPGLQVGISASR